MWDFACNPIDEPLDRTEPPCDPPEWIHDRHKAVLDPQAVYGLAVAEHAWAQAAITDYDPSRVGLIGGSIYGAFRSVVEQQALYDEGGERAVSGFFAINSSKIAVAALIAHRLQIQGHSKIITGACATGLYVLGDAMDLIRCGRADVVVATGFQAHPTDVVLAAYRNLRATSPTGWVRPFDSRRDGFIPTAGAAAIVLESEAHAVGRGASILGEVRGSGNTTDATMLPVSSGPAPLACIEEALRDADYAPEHIGQVSAHGTGTRKNDEFEAATLNEVFGASVPPVTAPKRVLGHSFGATGVQAAVLALESMKRGAIPPVGIDVERDPACDVPLVVGEPQQWDPAPALILGYGLGGHNGALVIAPWAPDRDTFGTRRAVGTET